MANDIRDVKRAHSLERVFNKVCMFIGGLVFFLLGLILYLIEAHSLAIVTCLSLALAVLVATFHYLKRKIFSPFYTLSAVLEAIRNEDYSLRAHSEFNTGAVKLLNDEVSMMSKELHKRKLQYDQHAVLVINLINQLAMPVAIFDECGQIEHANDAFSSWLGFPWQNKKKCSAKHFDLCFEHEQTANRLWQFSDDGEKQNWQLKYSQFQMNGAPFYLVILSNVEKVVNETEKLAWQRMSRVLGHEINNSLAPIQSLAESMISILPNIEPKQLLEPLNVILTRSRGLMQFVNRYGQLNTPISVETKKLDAEQFINQVTLLFDRPIVKHINIKHFYSDPVLLEQVLVNLIKNAFEANTSTEPVEIEISAAGGKTTISVIDSGVGITNFNNLFVPFYTTKESGSGIGLALSRNIVEALRGRLFLKNRIKAQGAIAIIELSALPESK